MTEKENELVFKEDSSHNINGDKESKKSKDSKEEMVLDEYVEKEDKENNENETKEDKENNEVNTEQILSDSKKINLTWICPISVLPNMKQSIGKYFTV